jgi:hypothetical protein
MIKMNGLINRKTIMEAWTFLREKNNAIPSETLDFIRDAALEKLKDLEDMEKAYDQLQELKQDIYDFENNRKQL